MRPIEIAIAMSLYVAVLGAAYAYPQYRASSVAAARSEAVATCWATVRQYHDERRGPYRIENRLVEDAFRCEREVLTGR